MIINDVHAHFFSAGFFRALARDLEVDGDPALGLPARLGWEPPGSNHALADRWRDEMDRHEVSRAVLIASVPADEASVAEAVERHPDRFIGAFMANQAAPDAAGRIERAFTHAGLQMVCLFPAMHHVPVDDPRSRAVFDLAKQYGKRVFVHCGVLSVGVRSKLGLSSDFDLRLGDPLAVAAVAVRYPMVPVIIPHFGAGFFREALMAVEAAPNILLDTSSSNSWIRLVPGVTMASVFARAIEIAGPSRILFGSDSSFFPRGWQRPIYERQRAVLTDIGVDVASAAAIMGGNFERVFGTVVPRT
jgi:predicted TIM-barrel fold metal-dependent hydrolase